MEDRPADECMRMCGLGTIIDVFDAAGRRARASEGGSELKAAFLDTLSGMQLVGLDPCPLGS